jgi:hypothetical protein
MVPYNDLGWYCTLSDLVLNFQHMNHTDNGVHISLGRHFGEQYSKDWGFCCISCTCGSCWAICCCAWRIWCNTSVCVATNASVSFVGGGGCKHHYPKHRNHWGYCVSVRPSENWVFIKLTFVSLLIKLISRTCTRKLVHGKCCETKQHNGHKHKFHTSLLMHR